MPITAVAKNIKDFRNSKNISEETIAKALNVTPETISNWESGKTQPDIDMLIAISKALDVEVTELIYTQEPFSEYDALKKDRVKAAIILVAVFVFLILVSFSQSYIHQQRKETFAAVWILLLLLLQAFVFPLIYGIGGATFLSVLAIWKDIRINSYKARKSLLIFSTAIIWVYFILISLYFSYSQVYEFAIIVMWLLSNPAIFIVPGLCLYLSLNEKKADLKKPITIVSIITLCAIILCAIAITRAYRL